MQKYPYFALPHILRARVEPGAGRLFVAATYAANRTLLRQALHGTVSPPSPLGDLKPTPAPMMEAAPTRPLALPDFTPHHWQAPLVAQVPASLAPYWPVPADQPLGIGRPPAAPLPGYAWLHATVMAHTQRHHRLIAQVCAQLRAPQPPPPTEDDPADMFDRFIAARSPRPRPQPRLINQPAEHEAARNSLLPDDELVTETLALLHLRQHNHHEATRIYEKLRLRFPEKSAYFEAQIRKIKTT